MPLVAVSNFKLMQLTSSDFGLEASTLFGHPISSVATAIAVAADNTIYFLYGGRGYDPIANARVFKMAFVNGELTFVWGLEITCTTAGYNAFGADIAVNPVSGHIFVGGHALKPTYNRTSVVWDITPTGILSQTHCWESAYGCAIECDPSGAVYFGSRDGYNNPTGYAAECMQIRKIVNGTTVWKRAIGGQLINAGPGKIKYINGNLYVSVTMSSNSSCGVVEVINTDGTSLKHWVVGNYSTYGTYYSFVDVASTSIDNFYAAGQPDGLSISWVEGANYGTHKVHLDAFFYIRPVALSQHGSNWYMLVDDTNYASPKLQLWKMSSNTCVRKFTISSTIGQTLLGSTLQIKDGIAYIVGSANSAYFIITLNLESNTFALPSTYGTISVTAENANAVLTNTAGTMYNPGALLLASNINMVDFGQYYAVVSSSYAPYTGASLFNPVIPATSLNWWDWAGNDFSVDAISATDSSYLSLGDIPASIDWWDWSGSDLLVDSAYISSAVYGPIAAAPASNNWWGWTGQDFSVDVLSTSATLFSSIAPVPASINWWDWTGNDFNVDRSADTTALYKVASVPANNSWMTTWAGNDFILDISTNNLTLQAA